MKLLRILIPAISVIALSFAATPSPATAAGTVYQLPCFPYGNANYNYGQYVNGWGYHVAEDVCHDAGTPVYAISDGTVMFSAKTPDSYRWGNLIAIQHNNSDGGAAVSIYGHLAWNRAVSPGQFVYRGQLIGYVGNSGSENGFWDPHLHFGVHPGGYGAGTGSYAPWIHGYESSMPSGWTHPSGYVAPRRLPWESQMAGVRGGGEIYNSGSTQVTFHIDNTGSNTWQAGGSNPVRLASIGPRDRGSGFSDNGQAAGWVGTNRIELDKDTAPGQRATFTATFVSPRTVGWYNECFSPIVEGVNWMPERPYCVAIYVQPPWWRAELTKRFVTATPAATDVTESGTTDTLLPGDRRHMKLYFKNVGELPWDVDGDNLVRLGMIRPIDRPSGFATMGASDLPAGANWVSPSRASGIDGRYDPSTNSVVADTQITQGEIAVFSFTTTAPDAADFHPEYVIPVVEGKTWMGDVGAGLNMRVLQAGDHYEPAGQTNGSVTYANGTAYQDVTVRLRNIGRNAWPVGGALRLGTDRPRDHASSFITPSGTGAWVGTSRPATVTRNVTQNGKPTIEAGEVAEFSFRLTIPDFVVGKHRLYVRAVRDGVGWLAEDPGIFIPVTVPTAAYDHQVMAQRFSGDRNNFTKGSTMTVDLAVRNTGRVPWPTSGSQAVKLATERPKDRGSGFATLSGSDPWPSVQRASLIDGRVTNLNTLATTNDDFIDPGETALFKVVVTAAPNPGSYQEYFNLVREGVSWFPDKGIYFPFVVKQPGGGGGPPQPAPSAASAGTPSPSIAPKPTSPTPSSSASPTTN